jgi:hypothetical protein
MHPRKSQPAEAVPVAAAPSAAARAVLQLNNDGNGSSPVPSSIFHNMPQAEKAELYEPMHARKPIAPIDVAPMAEAAPAAAIDVAPMAATPLSTYIPRYNNGPYSTAPNNPLKPKDTFTRTSSLNHPSNSIESLVERYIKEIDEPVFFNNEDNKTWLLDVIKRVNTSSRVDKKDKYFPRPVVLDLVKLKLFVDNKNPSDSLTTVARDILNKYSTTSPYKEIFDSVLGNWKTMPLTQKKESTVKEVSNNIIYFVLNEQLFMAPPRFKRGGRTSTRAAKKISKRKTRKL